MSKFFHPLKDLQIPYATSEPSGAGRHRTVGKQGRGTEPENMSGNSTKKCNTSASFTIIPRS